MMKRGKLHVGERVYFNGVYQFDGFPTKEEALDHLEGATVGDEIRIALRQFVGIYQARVSFGAPNDRGARKAAAWEWVTAPPNEVTYYEWYDPDLDSTSSFDCGADINDILMNQWEHQHGSGPHHIACWRDLADTQYRVTLAHVETRIQADASLDSLQITP